MEFARPSRSDHKAFVERVQRRGAERIIKGTPSFPSWESLERMSNDEIDGGYDVFVSYKSEDVVLVRAIVDGLIAAGARVWFAEYEILLSQRDRFQERIDEGIKRSARGVAFTNDRYVQSCHCRHELELLLAHVGPERMFEVALPKQTEPRREFPDLARAESLESQDAGCILRHVARWIGAQLIPRPQLRRWPYRDAAGWHWGTSASTRVFQGELLGRPYTVALDGWTIEKDPARQARFRDMLPEFKYAALRPAVYANVAAGLDTAPQTQRLHEIRGDRAVYEYLLEYAPKHLSSVGAQVHGVHLLVQDGRSQMALTYRSGSFWTRKVSITLPNPAVAATGEFVFTFGVMGSFEEYCLMSPDMDRLALSLRWH